MTFAEKIQKILAANPYNIRTINSLETYCGLSTSSISRYVKENKEPKIKLYKRIIEALHIPQSWWDNPIGNPFLDPIKVYKELSERIEKLELQNALSTRDNQLLVIQNRELVKQNNELERRVYALEKKSRLKTT